MTEKFLYKKISRMTVGIVLTSIGILIGGGLISHSLEDAQVKSVKNQMHTEVYNYNLRIQHRIDKDFETLNSMAAFIEPEQLENPQEFLKALKQTSAINGFIRMGYYKTNGKSIRIDAANSQENTPLTELQLPLREVISAAMQGHQTVSTIYYDEELKMSAISLGVPIYRNNLLVGVLTATNSILPLKSIVDSTTYTESPKFIHVIDKEGHFLVQGQKTVGEDHNRQSFYTDILSDQEIQAVRSALRSGQEEFIIYKYHGKDYAMLIQPLPYHDWYIVFMDAVDRNTSPILQMLSLTRYIAIAIVMLGSFLLFYGFIIFRRNHELLYQIAYMDEVTGIYNDKYFKNSAAAKLKKSSDYAIIVINIRHFNLLNDLLGHSKSNDLLHYIGSVFKSQVHEDELYCHEKADQFLLLLKETDRTKIQQRYQDICREIEKFMDIQHVDSPLQLYAGAVSCQSRKNTPLDELLSQAYFALKKAKLYSKSFMFYDGSLHKRLQHKVSMESQMRLAMERKEFKLYLQPKFSVAGKELACAEALVRWQQPDGTILYPNEFIPLFEENGFCVDLDFYMLDQVCRKLRSWIDAGKTPIPISVNQSRLTLCQPDYVERLLEITGKWRIDHALINLEMLESTMIENVSLYSQLLTTLRQHGFFISMDDFGSAYSSLNILGSLPVDEVKLDKDFLIMSRENRERQSIIMEMIIDLSKKLHIKTVVEGVETEDDLKLITDLHADYGQGYYYSHPIAAEEFDKKYMQ